MAKKNDFLILFLLYTELDSKLKSNGLPYSFIKQIANWSIHNRDWNKQLQDIKELRI